MQTEDISSNHGLSTYRQGKRGTAMKWGMGKTDCVVGKPIPSVDFCHGVVDVGQEV